MTRRTIPQIRARLIELAAEHGIPELEELALETKRRPHVRKAPARSVQMTDRVAEDIRRYAAKHPRMPYAQIGVHFNLNQGRVSEALAGKRS